MVSQSTNHILMIKPAIFYKNAQTIESNHYQIEGENEDIKIITIKAIKEFNDFKLELESNGINILCFEGSKECPDHIFPNWFTTFSDKTMQIFSMLAPNRRTEKTPEIISYLQKDYDLTHNYSSFEDKDVFLEGTSSMVFDRVNRIVYAGLSPRTNQNLLTEWCKEHSYELVKVQTESHTGAPIYHTDVFMFVGTDVIGICYEVIKSEYRELLKEKVSKYHTVMEISKEQILDFCGNALEAKDKEGNLYLIMSSRAHDALNHDQLNILNTFYKKIIHSDLPTIEKYGGGSARCMLSELF
ncbi:arginine deiminase-related protein [Gammaproteobacteria bacterium]|nr:arginine deiminase-related protein [Gammaproteobacteria bacterium]MDA9001447.1 arginine deiminase-related protein [Gammaproteobacteria bacterium]MDC0439657.1 arginine deiminase-related protein [Gammaproteobacteria bacterium]